jgi:hypothetical protein
VARFLVQAQVEGDDLVAVGFIEEAESKHGRGVKQRVRTR